MPVDHYPIFPEPIIPSFQYSNIPIAERSGAKFRSLNFHNPFIPVFQPLTSMIYGIGIDMVEIPRIEKALECWGDRFLTRVFTQAEIKYCQQSLRAASRFALRFAAKEAFSKALGSGFRNGLGLRHIEVLRGPDGHPRLGLHMRAKELCERHGINNSFVSLSDSGLYAVAVVVLEV